MWEYAGAYHWLMKSRGEPAAACDITAFRQRHPDLDGQTWGAESECFAASVVEGGGMLLGRPDDRFFVIDEDGPAAFIANGDDTPVAVLEPDAV